MAWCPEQKEAYSYSKWRVGKSIQEQEEIRQGHFEGKDCNDVKNDLCELTW